MFGFENFSNLLWGAGAVLLWALLGLWAFRAYVFSPYELRTKWERVLVAICGPAVWFKTWRLKRKYQSRG